MDQASGEPPPAATDPSRPAPKPLGLSSNGVFLITLVVQLIGYIPTYFLTHHLGNSNPALYLLGTIQLFLLISSSINGIGDLRIGSAFTYFVSRGEHPSHGLTTYLVLRFALVATAGVALFLLAPILEIDMASQLEIFGVWMLFPVFWSFSTVYMQTWVALGDSIRSQGPLLLESIVRAGALSYVAIFLVNVSSATATLWAVTGAYALGVAVSTVASFPMVWRNRGVFRKEEGARMLRWAWPLMGSLILLYIASNLIPFIVAGQLGRDWLAIFSAANGFRILALGIPAAISLPLFPYLVGLHKRREFEAIRSGTWQALRYTAMVVIPGVVALAVYRKTILNVLYTTVFAQLGATALAILAVASVPAALSVIIGTSLNSIGRQRLELYLTSLQVGVLFVAAPILIAPPKFLSDHGVSGINGAAAAVLLSALAGLALNTYFMERLLAVRIRARPIATICLSAVAAFVAISRLNAYINVNRYYTLTAGVVLGFLVYGGVLIATGELTKADVELIGSSIGLPTSARRAIQRLCRRESPPEIGFILPGQARGLVETEDDTLGAAGPAGDRGTAKPPQ